MIRRIVLCGLVLTLMSVPSVCLAKKASITLWSLSGLHTQCLEEQLTRFNKAEPDIEVELQAFPWAAYWEKLLPSFAVKRGPDVFLLHPIAMKPYLDADILVPVPENVFSDTEIKQKWFECAWRTWYRDGKHYGLQLSGNPNLFVYNKDLFKESGLDPNVPPETWDELAEYATRLTKRDSTGKMLQSGYGAVGGGEEVYALWYYAGLLGGRVISPDGKYVVVNSPEYLQAFEFIRDLVYKYEVSSRDFLDITVGFQQNKIAMTSIYISFANDLKRNYPDVNFATAPLPTPYRGMPPKAYWWGDWGVVVTSNARGRGTAVEEASWKFIEFIHTQEEYIASLPYWSAPVRKDIQSHPAYSEWLSEYPYMKPAIDKMPYTYFEGPLTNYWGGMDKEFQNMFDRVFTQGWDPEKALDELAETANRIIQE